MIELLQKEIKILRDNRSEESPAMFPMNAFMTSRREGFLALAEKELEKLGAEDLG